MQPTSDALVQAQATIALLQTYVAALGGTIGLMGAFFGYKWISTMVDDIKASSAQTASNEKLAAAVAALTDAVTRGRQAP